MTASEAMRGLEGLRVGVEEYLRMLLRTPGAEKQRERTENQIACIDRALDSLRRDSKPE